MMKTRCLTYGVFVFFLTATTASLADDVDDIRARAHLWADSFDNGDPDFMVSLYAEDAILHGTGSPVLREGKALIREYFAGAGATPPPMFFLEPMHIRVFGDTAVNTGNYAVRIGTDEPITMRYSKVYRKIDGQWLIIDHHSSRMP